jgi:hypothetical protein
VAGAVTSTPALLRVKSVQLYLGSQLLTNGTYVFTSPPTLSVRSAFANGSSFYSRDGSPPTFASTYYSGPFTLSQSATVRAIGYTADFAQSEEADPITATVLVRYRLSGLASGGGFLSTNAGGVGGTFTEGVYLQGETVDVTAVPLPGFTFLYWLGDATGSDPTVKMAMESDKTIQAVFGTTLSTTVAGSGQVLLDAPGGVYPYGTVVRLTAVPQQGNYFGFWGNAATGNANPLYFTVTNANPTVSSIFAANPEGQAELTVLVQGRGRVTANPRANSYLIGQSVVLTAVPEPGQSFLGWSGDASGTQNPLNLSITQRTTLTAQFTSRPSLSVDTSGLEGLSSSGFRLSLVSDPQTSWQILGSTNLTLWEPLGTVTNIFGHVQFTDPASGNKSWRFYKAVSFP